MQRHGVHYARGIRKRLLAIPIAYVLLRLWDFVQTGLGLTTLKEPLACGNHSVQVAAFAISVMQVKMHMHTLIIMYNTTTKCVNAGDRHRADLSTYCVDAF